LDKWKREGLSQQAEMHVYSFNCEIISCCKELEILAAML